MKKIILVLSAISVIFLIACSQNKPIACAADAKVCPDGSAVGRAGPNCEFADCPKKSDSSVTSIVELCETENPRFDANEECQKIIEQKYSGKKCTFTLGQVSWLPLGSCRNCTIKCQENQETEPEQHYCTTEQRKGEICPELYKPVCGWFDPAKIQCIKYPCAQTFSNSCFACHDGKVLYWTEGECPK